MHSCRQFCSAWNNFILENIWSSQYAKNSLEKQLTRNWFEIDSEDVETEEVFHFALAENFFVVESKNSDDDMKHYRNLVVQNITTKDVWRIENFVPIDEEEELTVIDVSQNLIAACYKNKQVAPVPHSVEPELIASFIRNGIGCLTGQTIYVHKLNIFAEHTNRALRSQI